MMEAFFLELKLTMVISHCQDHGSVACALRSGLLKTELKPQNLILFWASISLRFLLTVLM